MTAPSIKEALTNIAAISACVAVVDNPTSHVEMLSKINAISVGALKALATFQPDGERREAIARELKIAFVEKTMHHPIGKYQECIEHVFNAMADAILASGLMQDEAGIRADERERCAEIADLRYEPVATEIAAAIRSARDGGAET